MLVATTVLAAWMGAAEANAADARHAGMIGRLVRRGDDAAVEYVVKQVKHGMPPRSMEAFLEAAREKPQAEYVPLLRRATTYRKPRYRALALVALAAVDRDHGEEAALRALDDPSLDVRLLGLRLADEFTAPNVEEAVIKLLARDHRLAKIVRG